LIIAVFCGIPLVIIEEQPDLSTTIDLFLILLAMIFLAGLSYKLIGIVILLLIPITSVFFWYIQQPNQVLLDEYQLGRILAFRYPQDYALTTGYQQSNSVMAIGSGMLTGKGIASDTLATVKDANLISEQQTDFIFSVVGEELGFIGCTFIIAIILLVVLQCIHVARKAQDTEGMLIAGGVATLFCFQAFINIGVATQILPNTGLPLPFVSYGLSSLLSCCVGVGLVLNIGLHRKKY
jgi:rod shape determining protein RodA